MKFNATLNRNNSGAGLMAGGESTYHSFEFSGLRYRFKTIEFFFKSIFQYPYFNIIHHDFLIIIIFMKY